MCALHTYYIYHVNGVYCVLCVDVCTVCYVYMCVLCVLCALCVVCVLCICCVYYLPQSCITCSEMSSKVPYISLVTPITSWNGRKHRDVVNRHRRISQKAPPRTSPWLHCSKITCSHCSSDHGRYNTLAL